MIEITEEEREEIRRYNTAIAEAGSYYAFKRGDLMGLMIAEKIMEANLMAVSQIEPTDDASNPSHTAMMMILEDIRFKIKQKRKNEVN